MEKNSVMESNLSCGVTTLLCCFDQSGLDYITDGGDYGLDDITDGYITVKPA